MVINIVDPIGPEVLWRMLTQYSNNLTVGNVFHVPFMQLELER